MATTITMSAMPNWVIAETVSACTALSVLATICSYCAIRLSTDEALFSRPLMFLSTCPSVFSIARQHGMNFSRIACRAS